MQTIAFLRTSILRTIPLYALALIIPLAFSSSQFVTGSLVNSLLFLSALKLTARERAPVAILPSIGAILHGVLFGPQTIYLYYFLPMLWVSNVMLMELFIALRHRNAIINIGVGAIGKYLMLQLAANLYISTHIVPSVFASAMGYIQLATALTGGLIALIITRHERR